jgi:small subunit ribosomal protein S1
MAHPDDTEDFASLLAQFEQQDTTTARRRPRVGELIRGRVVSIGQDAVFVDVGGKAEGVLALTEVRKDDGTITVAVGDTIEARVVDTSGGSVTLRRVLGRGAEGKAELQAAHEHGIPVEGTVTGLNKGGLEVQIAGVRAFCPISQIEIRHVDDATPFIGQKLNFKITRYEEGPRGRDANIVVSRRALLEEEAKTKAAELRERLAVGEVFHGTVTTIKDYGAFIDLGGIEGMLHVSEIGFARVSHPRDVLSVGQTVDVQILKIEKSDDPRRPEKISLSLKSLEHDPWEGAAERFPEGARLKGTVVRVEQYGAFVEVTPGVEGLIHISELGGGKPLKHAREAVRPGAAVEVTVLTVDTERRRLSLSLATGDSAEEAEVARPTAPRSLGTLGDLLKKKR